MMQAAESPWQMRPSIREGDASAPDGARPTRSEPTMLRMKPDCTTFTRPTRSASPPMTTMKMPGEQRRDRHGDVHHAHLDPEIRRHGRRDVQRRLGKQPEGQHAQDHPEER